MNRHDPQKYYTKYVLLGSCWATYHVIQSNLFLPFRSRRIVVISPSYVILFMRFRCLSLALAVIRKQLEVVACQDLQEYSRFLCGSFSWGIFLFPKFTATINGRRRAIIYVGIGTNDQTTTTANVSHSNVPTLPRFRMLLYFRCSCYVNTAEKIN